MYLFISWPRPFTKLLVDRSDCNTLLTKHVLPEFTNPFKLIIQYLLTEACKIGSKNQLSAENLNNSNIFPPFIC